MELLHDLFHILGDQGFVGLILASLTVAFTAWAFVVWHMGKIIINKLEKLDRSVTYLDHRILKLETYLELKDSGFKPYRNGLEEKH